MRGICLASVAPLMPNGGDQTDGAGPAVAGDPDKAMVPPDGSDAKRSSVLSACPRGIAGGLSLIPGTPILPLTITEVCTIIIVRIGLCPTLR